MNDTTTSTEPTATKDLQLGGFDNILMNQDAFTAIERMAKAMATAKVTVPDHLRGNEGDCFAIAMQSAQWRMNPFAVAQKTHLVHGTLGYEAQLVNAVINAMAPTKDRLHFEWFGPWDGVIGKFTTKTGQNGSYQVPNWKPDDERGCGVRVWATLKGEDQPRELELLLSQATVRNSTLWAADPRQQLAYLATKRWARLYCPDVILGVYTTDELNDHNERTIQGEVVEPATPRATAPEELPEYPADQFDASWPKWEAAMEAGKIDAKRIVDTVSSKFQMTDAQVSRLYDLEESMKEEA